MRRFINFLILIFILSNFSLPIAYAFEDNRNESILDNWDKGSIAGEIQGDISEQPENIPTLKDQISPDYTVMSSLGTRAITNIDLELYTSAYVQEDTHHLYMWGTNSYNLNDLGEINRVKEPLYVMNNVEQVGVGTKHCTVLKTDGTVWCWGENSEGQLGNGTVSSDYTEPTQVLDHVVQIGSNANANIALKDDGSVYFWGMNVTCDPETSEWTSVLEPTKVEGLNEVQQIAIGGYHCAAIKEDGSLWMWGNNTYGALGDGTIYSSAVPKFIMDNVSQVSLGAAHSGVIKTDGSIQVWGNNQEGQIGNGSNSDADGHVLEPFEVPIGHKVSKLILGDFSTAAITEDNNLWMWGSNDYGELGNNSTVNAFLPIHILENVKTVGIGFHHTVAQKLDGSIWAWGVNEFCQVGDGTTTNRLTPVNLFEEKDETIPTINNPFDFNLGTDSTEGPTVDLGPLSFTTMKLNQELNFSNFSYSQTVDKKKRTIRQALGLKNGFGASTDLGSQNKDDTLYNNIKTLVNSPDNNTYVKSQLDSIKAESKEIKLGVACKGSFVGYTEYKYELNGETKFNEGGAIIVVTSSLELPKYTPSCTGGLVAIKCTIACDSKGNLILKPDKSGLQKLLSMELSPSLKFSAENGVGENFELSGSITGTLSNKIDFDSTKNKTLKQSLKQSGKISFSYRCAWGGLFNYTNTLFETEVQLYPKNTAKDKKGTEKKESLKRKNAEVNAQLLQRDYQKNGVFTQENDTFLIEDILPYNHPQIATLADGRVINVWLQDNGRTDSLSFTEIAYSIRDLNGNWSTKQIIDSNDRTNIKPILCVDGNECYLLWTRTKSNMDLDSSPESFFSNLELAISKLEDSTFQTPQVVTYRSHSPLISALEIFNNEVYIAWVENENNDFSSFSGINNLFLKKLGDPSELINSNIGPVYNLEVNEGKAYYLLSDKEEQSELHTFDGSTEELITSINSKAFNLKSFNHNLYWVEESNVLYSLQNDQISMLTDKCEGDYTVLDTNESRSLIINKKDGFKSELYISRESDNDWTDLIPITFEDQYISAFATTLDPQTQKPILFYDRTQVLTERITQETPEPYGRTDLIIDDYDDYYDLEVDPSLYSLGELVPNEQNDFSTIVKNVGTKPVSSIILTVTTNKVDVLYHSIQPCDLKVGESQTFNWNGLFPRDFEGRILEATVCVYDLDEKDYTNNKATLILDPEFMLDEDQSYDNPDIPSEPDNPDEPTQPDTPVDPDNSDKPVDPDNTQPSNPVDPGTTKSSAPIYRLYNSNTGEHLFTPSPDEERALVSAGWTSEGTGWNAPQSGTSVYRLFNPEISDHLYTSDENEVRVLTTERGWKADFGGGPVFYSSGSGTSIYRLYNDGNKRHLLTRDENEYNVLPSQGWAQEGVAFYGLSQ